MFVVEFRCLDVASLFLSQIETTRSMTVEINDYVNTVMIQHMLTVRCL